MSYYKQNKNRIIKDVLKLRQSSIELRQHRTEIPIHTITG
jgi:hypothetical protein